MGAIRVEIHDPETIRLWRLTEEIVSILAGLPWVLIGGQMVEIIEREAGGRIGRRTGDIDVLMDLRAAGGSLREAADRLMKIGFAPALAPDGLTYRFVRRDDIVDLLAPDNLGQRSNLVTSPPGATIGVTGGTQALGRRRQVDIEVGGHTFTLPVPTLVGAIVIKTRATISSHGAERKWRHQRDLARLLVLIDDIEAIRAEMTAKERAALRSLHELSDPAHPAWRGIPNSGDGIIAFRRLGDPLSTAVTAPASASPSRAPRPDRRWSC